MPDAIDIDIYLESILKAAGSSLRHYESYSKDAMRKAMREIVTTAGTRELESVRNILASTDIVSLPNDYPTAQMATDRMQRIKDLTLEGLGLIGRAETAEAALAEAREQAIRECAKIAFTWRTSATVRVGEYIAKAILALASTKTGGAK